MYPLYVEGGVDYAITVKQNGDSYDVDVKTNSLTTNELIALTMFRVYLSFDYK